MTNRLDKLLAIRKRVLGDFAHHTEIAMKFTEASDETAISFRSIAFEKTFKEFMDLTEALEKISAYHDLENIDALLLGNRQTHDKYLTVKLHLNQFVQPETAQLNASMFTAGSRSFTEESGEANTSTNHSTALGVKLPNINLTPFDGSKAEDWPEFRDMFKSIMKKYRGDNVEKFTHLKNYLRGSALGVVKHLGVHNDSYDAAWELLAAEFENKKAIVDAHLNRFTTLPTITPATPSTIREAVTTTRSSLAAMNRLDIMTETWDPIIVYLLTEKLDPELRGKWEEERKGSHDLPPLKSFLEFLEVRHRIIASVQPRKPIRTTNTHTFESRTPKVTTASKPIKTFINMDETAIDETDRIDKANGIEEFEAVFYTKHPEICGICGQSHRVFQCSKLTANASEALKIVNEQERCTNCLYKHNVSECISKYTCQKCKQRHHTLLHDAFVNGDGVHTIQMMYTQPQAIRALLATALIPVRNNNGKEVLLRALIDQGSTANLISEKGVHLLQCHRYKIAPIPMLGVGDMQTGVGEYKTTFMLGSLYDRDFALAVDAYIAPLITSVRPITTELIAKWDHLKNLELADPSSTNTSNIDLLIGSITFTQLLEDGLIRGQAHEPVAQKTKLGWIVSGACENMEKLHINVHQNSDIDQLYTNSQMDLSTQLKAFWEMEEPPYEKVWTEAERACDEYFTQTVTRSSDGKFIMRIPFNFDRNSPDFLGDSFEAAKRRWLSLERRFEKDLKLKHEYAEGIHGYLDSKQAIKVPMENLCHVIPHHAVIKESSETTKLRTVYDASAKTTNGYSLNDRMHIGPTILENLLFVLIRWRMGKIAVTSDIEKMYRQFWVHPDDTKYLQILWRDKVTEPIELLQLQTVTFGTAAAPYMAIKGLHLIAESVKIEQPMLCRAIKKCFYVDDYLESFDTPMEATEQTALLMHTLSSYGLNLRKWHSNTKDFESDTDTIVEVKTNPDSSCTTLGMRWNTETDQLSYNVAFKKETMKFTKRTVLSEIASLFDPLGLLAPAIMRAKVFMQQLWLGAFNWDDELTADLKTEWRNIRTSLLRCAHFNIPRWIGYAKTNEHVSLHGFCDASEKAYAAAIYLRTEHQDGTIATQLIMAKTKVAPLAKITIPRLELCAAQLLAKTMKQVQEVLEIPIMETYAWTDSGITLAWITTPPYKLKTFVSNRVAEIQKTIPSQHWRFVRTTDNPADYATRCNCSSELIFLTKWWTGPAFLADEPDKWPKIPPHMIAIKNVPELKIKCLTQLDEADAATMESPILTRFSSMDRLIRTTAMILRWLNKHRQFRKRPSFIPSELIDAKGVWVRHVQYLNYSNEIRCLKNKKPISTNSQLLSLSPILDNDGILRVRGRLEKSLLGYDAKHPIILPAKSHLTILIIQKAHFKSMHGGMQLTLRTIREEFWIVRGKATVKTQLNKCITCFRDLCHPAQQQMADLLEPQVQPNRPFSHTGVDFAGYFEVKLSRKRTSAYTKCYVSLFVCLTTKALHLELAHDLSTQAFIAALNRFVSRRGIPNHMYSDRGTNFIGAARELPNLWYQENSEESKLIQNECAKHGITWHFNPARASHFGGLWEAGVKSMKTHLHRVLRGVKLNYEDFNTLLTQIEACLNSRPLCPISDDPNDYQALTPGNFLIGPALMTTPHPDVRHLPMNRLSRYQFLQRLLQDFWSWWSKEYLSRLQQRPKWKLPHPNLSVGQLVLIKEDSLPPSQWALGRITQTFPGEDGLTRSVEVKCGSNTLTRPIHKLCLLPIPDNMNDYEQLVYNQLLIPREDVDEHYKKTFTQQAQSSQSQKK